MKCLGMLYILPSLALVLVFQVQMTDAGLMKHVIAKAIDVISLYILTNHLFEKGAILLLQLVKYKFLAKRSIIDKRAATVDTQSDIQQLDEFMKIAANVDDKKCLARYICECLAAPEKNGAFSDIMRQLYSVPGAHKVANTTPAVIYSYAAQVGIKFKNKEMCGRAFSACTVNMDALRGLMESLFAYMSKT